MPVGINFSKDRAEYLLDCLAHGKPIEGVVTFDDMLALAGACFYAAMSHGPIRISETEWAKLPLERREAGEEQFFADLHSAIEFYSHLTMLVKDRSYDEAFEPTVKAIAFVSEGTNKVKSVQGFRTPTR